MSASEPHSPNTRGEIILPPFARPDQFKDLESLVSRIKSTILWEMQMAVACSSRLLDRFTVASFRFRSPLDSVQAGWSPTCDMLLLPSSPQLTGTLEAGPHSTSAAATFHSGGAPGSSQSMGLPGPTRPINLGPCSQPS